MTEPATTPESTPADAASSPKGRRPLLWVAIGVVGAVMLYLLTWPVPVDPIAWDPPEPTPLEGAWAPNEALAAATSIAAGELPGPEEVAVASDGTIYSGLEDGRVVRVGRDGTLTTVADTGGRPLGIAFEASGDLIVADAVKGLLRVALADGAITVLATEAAGVPFAFTNNVDVAADGRIYFSDASSKFGVADYFLDLFEGRPHGRLLRHDPASGETEVLLDGLYFANGVALSSDESFVVVAETYRFRIQRVWLTGEKAGTSDLFLDDAPGYIDNVSHDGEGAFWVALYTVRNAAGDFLAPRPFLRKMVVRLPRFTWPKPARHGCVFALDEDGGLIRTLQDPSGQTVAIVTGVAEHEGELFMGSLKGDRIWTVPLDSR